MEPGPDTWVRFRRATARLVGGSPFARPGLASIVMSYTMPPPRLDDDLRLEGQLCFALYAATHAYSRAYRPLLAALDLTYTQYLAMLVLWERDDLTVSVIGRRLLLDSATLTPLLKRLQDAGRVTRTRDQTDERVVRVKLTEAGRALKSVAATISGRIDHATGLAPQRLSDLRAMLTVLRTGLANVSTLRRP
jgi:DNA-binding MarR family transcriptional regulator